MVHRNIIDRRFNQKHGYPVSGALFILLCLFFLFACDSSDTRSTTKSATSSETELQVQVTSPPDGAYVGWTLKTGADEATADVEFTYTTSGGTEPVNVTWLIEGPGGYSNSSSGGNVLTFGPDGQYTLTAVATDANGLTASDAITMYKW